MRYFAARRFATSSDLTAAGAGLKQGFEGFIADLPKRALPMVGAWVLGITDQSKLNSLADVGDALLDKVGLSGEGLWSLVLSHKKVAGNVGAALRAYEFLEKGVSGLLAAANMGGPKELVDTAVGAARGVLIEEAARRVPLELAAMLNPTFGTIRKVYQVGMSFVRNVPPMAATLKGTIDSIDLLVGGSPNVGDFASAIQRSLENAVPRLLDFASSFVGFNPQEVIDKAIERMKKPLQDLINRALDLVPLPIPTIHGQPVEEEIARDTFDWKKPDGKTEKHTLWVQAVNGKIEFHVASKAKRLEGAQIDAKIKLIQTHYDKMIAVSKERKAGTIGAKAFKQEMDKLKEAANKGIRELIAKLTLPHARLDKARDIYVTAAGSLKPNAIPATDKQELLDYLDGKYPTSDVDHAKYGQILEKLGTDALKKTKAARIAEWGASSAIHAHHIVMRNGPAALPDIVMKESHAILEKGSINIDRFEGRENLVWAPNEKHTKYYAINVLAALKDAEPSGKTAVVDALVDQAKKFISGTNTLGFSKAAIKHKLDEPPYWIP